MSRRIDLSVPRDLQARVIERAREIPGIASVSLQANASLDPPGDVVCMQATNEAALALLEVLDEMGALERGSVTLGEPTAILAPRHLEELEQQGSEAAWEEVAARLRRGTNATPDFLLLMAMSGAIAVFGLVGDTLHVVIGAMLVAPGFEPLLRIPVGLLGRRRSAWPGLRSSLAGYLALAVGAAAAVPPALLLHDRAADALPRLHWVSYWSDVTASGAAVALLAGIAGATIVGARLTVFATGVMVALALVPGMALVGLGLASLNPGLALGGLLRWGADVLCVLVAGGAVLTIKRRIRHRRRVFD